MHAHTVHFLPTTKVGRWSIGLALGFFVFSFIWTFPPGEDDSLF